MSRGGGTERMTQILADTLSTNKNYNVSVISLSPCKKSYFPLSTQVKFYSLSAHNSKLGILMVFYELKKKVKQLHADIIINVDVFLSIYSIPIKLFFKKTKIVSWEMFNLSNDMGLSWCKHLRKFALTYSDYYVCLTKSDTQAFINHYKIRCPITYIYNPYEQNKKYEGYDICSKNIITVGNFFYTKGFDLAIDVAKIVLTKHKDWKWFFYGDGVEMEKLRRLVQNSNISSQLIFAGRTMNIMEKYKQSAFYVMTSRLESFGLVLLEAKCYNLPTIAFDVPDGPAEIIEDGISGYLVPAFDIKAMANCVEEMMIDTKKRCEFSKMAQNNISKFSIEEFRIKWFKLLDSLL